MEMNIEEIMKGTKDRLREYVRYKGITAAAFAQQIGKTKSYISSLAGSIAVETAFLIMKEFPDLNMMWLLFGVGEMLNGTNDGPSVAEERPNDEPTRNQKIDMDFAQESIRNLTAAVMEQNKIISTLVSKI